MARTKRSRFDLRRSPVDGMWRRWELRWASSVNDPYGQPALLDPEDAEQKMSDGTRHDYKVWVVTGVFRTRKEVFA